MKVALVDDAETVTEAGTVTAEGRLLLNDTTDPPAGAALDSVTVQDWVVEGAMEPFEHCTDVRLAVGATVRDAVWLGRARAFAMTAITQFRVARDGYGQGRYSLWTGDVGLAIYLWDCLAAEPHFPTIDIF